MVSEIPCPNGRGTENGGFPENGVAEYLSKNRMVATLRNGYSEFLLLACAEEEREIDVLSTLVVQDFLDVFPNDVPGLPSRRVIEFSIDIVPGMGPIRWHRRGWRQLSCQG